MRVLNRAETSLFAARSSKKEAAAQAIFLHAIGDGIIPGALWCKYWPLEKTSIAKEPAANRRRVVIIERDSWKLQRRTHGEGSLDRQTKSAAGAALWRPRSSRD